MKVDIGHRSTYVLGSLKIFFESSSNCLQPVFVQGSLPRILVLPAGIQNADLCTEQTPWWEVEAWKWPYNHYNVIGRK